MIDLYGPLEAPNHCGAVCWRAFGKPSTWFPTGSLVYVKLFSPQNRQFLKNDSAKSKTSFEYISSIRLSSTEALKYKESFKCNRITETPEKVWLRGEKIWLRVPKNSP